NGVKVYGLSPPLGAPLPLPLRADELLRMLVRLYAPLQISSLRQLAAMVGRDSLPDATRLRAFARLLKSDWLARGLVDGVEYLWPAGERPPAEAPERDKLLEPFAHIVCARRCFVHVCRWEYRLDRYYGY